ncbi:unnamed protein product [marine sediment metagenome]|uniref:Uncharacterized protein n=1 Tax=marine sediment metagenome TaxID=412755 RepID=X1L8E3_9ZZZZ
MVQALVLVLVLVQGLAQALVAQVFPQALARVSHLAEKEMAVVFEQGHMLQE